MIIVAYDIESDKKRNKFSKFLKQYGRRVQFSIFEVKNSQRILTNILNEVKYKQGKQFCGTDSVLIFSLCEGCKKKIMRYGYAKNEESELVFFE